MLSAASVAQRSESIAAASHGVSVIPPGGPIVDDEFSQLLEFRHECDLHSRLKHI